MRNRLLPLLALLALLLVGCARLEELPSSPATTPQQWCEQRPCVDIGGTVLNEPLGTLLVAVLALLWAAVGAYFLITGRGQRSRLWLGVALVINGVGAVLAGISFQAFSYELKCAGRDVCVLTNGFEVGYSLATAWSVSAFLTAVAYASTRPPTRRRIMVYAVANAVVYCAVLAAGVLLPSAVLLSFTVLLLFALPGIVLVMVVSWRAYRSTGLPVHRHVFIAAATQIAVNVAYYAYWAAGLTAALWNDGQGFYFSENDVLHVGLIAWLVFVTISLGPTLADDEQPSRV